MKYVVLLVDDEPKIPEMYARSLREEPFEFKIARSGEEALGILDREPVDVIVSDEKMPGMSGSEMLSIAAKKYPRTIRMIVTGFGTLESAVRCIHEGIAHRYFMKPCTPGNLAVAIHQALEVQARARARELLQREDSETRTPAIPARPSAPEPEGRITLDEPKRGRAKIEIEEIPPDAVEIRILGPVGPDSAQELTLRAEEHIESGRVNLVLNLSRTSYLASAGISALLRVNDIARRHGGRTLFVDEQGRIRKFLEDMGLGNLLRFVATRAEALSSLGGRPGLDKNT